MSQGLTRTAIAERAAQDIPDGWYVNLGIGLPTTIADHVPPGREVVFQSENGVLGIGPAPAPEQVDPWLINAGKQHVTLLPGGSYFHHADSFAMIRGGHLDLCVLGAFQVAENGDLANWTTSLNDTAPAIGGAMDLAIGCTAPVGSDGTHHPRRASAAGAALHLSADRTRRCPAHLYQPRRHRCRAAGFAASCPGARCRFLYSSEPD